MDMRENELVFCRTSDHLLSLQGVRYETTLQWRIFISADLASTFGLEPTSRKVSHLVTTQATSMFERRRTKSVLRHSHASSLPSPHYRRHLQQRFVAIHRAEEFFLRSRYGCEVLRWACLSVCLSARISKTTCPNFTKFYAYASGNSGVISSCHIHPHFPPWCGASFKKYLWMWHHFLSKIVIVRTFS